MISVENIKDLTQGFLNANSLGIEFKLYADVGEITREELSENYTENKVVGLLEFLPSNIVGQGFKFLQLETKMTIYIDGTKMKQSLFNQKIDRIKGIINNVIASKNRIPATYKIDGIDYNTTISFGLPQNLDLTSLGYMKKTLPVEVYMSWTILLNGVSSNSVKFYVDGHQVVANTWNIDRTRIVDANAKEGDEHTKSVEKVNGITITLNSPLLDDALGSSVYDDVMSGETNNAHLVHVEKGTRADNYICIFGDNGLAGQEGLNVGSKFSLVEGDEDLLEYGAGWNNTEIDIEQGQLVRVDMAVPGVVFWGDGENSEITESQSIAYHEYSNTGSYIIRIFGEQPEISITSILKSGQEFNSIIKTLVNSSDDIEIIEFGNYDNSSNNSYTISGENVIDGLSPISVASEGVLNAYYADNVVYILGRYSEKIMANINCSRMFYELPKLREIVGLEKVDFSSTNNMEEMFKFSCTYNYITINWNLSSMNVSNVTTMQGMFSGFGTAARVVANLNVSGWDASKVITMENMFYLFGHNATRVNLNLSGFKTKNVENMSSMFRGVAANRTDFELDLSSFDTHKVRVMPQIFAEMSSLKTIKVDPEKWSIDAITSGGNEFYGCVNLVGGAGTTYDSNNVSYLMAKIDGGVNNPGYLTEA